MNKKLSDKVQIGCVTAGNRIAVPPMVCFHWSDDTGRVTEKNIRHYGSLARGGAGLIIAEATAVTKRARLHETNLGLWEDGQIEGFKRLADAVHACDTPFFVQLLHAGLNGIDPEAETASDYTFERPGRVSVHAHAMTRDRIERTVEDFVNAALRAQKAGMDGVELHGCHSYLFSQFMSSAVNHRTDAYGRERHKFALDTLKAVRQVCGSRFAVGIRLAAFEPTLEDGIAHAAALAEASDFLDISYGFFEGMKAEKPADYPYSAAVYGAGEIKKRLPDMPVFGVDGITGAEDALGAINLADLDMIDVGRGSLVNYHFANCALSGQPTGKCLHCRPACKWSPFPNGGAAECPGRKLYENSIK